MSTLKPYIGVCRKCEHLSLVTLTYHHTYNPTTQCFGEKNCQHHFECGLLHGIGSAKRKIGILDHVPSAAPDNDYTHAHTSDMTVPTDCPYRLEHVMLNDQYKGTKADLDQMQRFASETGLLVLRKDAGKDEVPEA